MARRGSAPAARSASTAAEHRFRTARCRGVTPPRAGRDRRQQTGQIRTLSHAARHLCGNTASDPGARTRSPGTPWVVPRAGPSQRQVHAVAPPSSFPDCAEHRRILAGGRGGIIVRLPPLGLPAAARKPLVAPSGRPCARAGCCSPRSNGGGAALAQRAAAAPRFELGLAVAVGLEAAQGDGVPSRADDPDGLAVEVKSRGAAPGDSSRQRAAA